MKIFGLGLRKTGLNTLRNSLEILGYDITQSTHKITQINSYGNLELFIDDFDMKDGLMDDPVPLFFKELDELYPNSKFILTTRDIDSWLNSAENHFSLTRKILRRHLRKKVASKYINEMYSSESFEIVGYKQAFINYQDSVIQYFKGREDDLLVYSFKDGWNPLCKFLDKPCPDIHLPHKNKRTTLRNRILSLI